MAFFIGNNLFRSDKPAPPRKRPDYMAALEKYAGSAKSSVLHTTEHFEEIPYNSWRLTVTYAEKYEFSEILEFFVTVPAVRELLSTPETELDWFWEKHRKEPFSELIDDEYMVEKLVELLNNQVRIERGWTLKKDYGRIDEDVTYHDFSYLFESELYYVYLQEYAELIH